MKNLYVVGNGFDLHHNYNSKYVDFREFLKINNYELLQKIERYLASESFINDYTYHDYDSHMDVCEFDEDDLREYMEYHYNDSYLWSNLEQALAKINVGMLFNDNSSELKSYGDDNWSDSYHHSFQDNVEEALKAITEDLKCAFREWICTLGPNHSSNYFDDDEEYYDEHDNGEDEYLEYDEIQKLSSLNNLSDSHYINFNYTNSIEQLYNIDKSKITYIHGKADSSDSEIILGHGFHEDDFRHYDSNSDISDEEYDNVEDQFNDPRESIAYERIVEAFRKNSKPTQRIISNNIDIFNEMNEVDEIFVLGHSISEVDQPYFREIIANIDERNVNWNITYYNSDEKEKHLETMNSLGISEDRIRLVKLENL